MKFTIEKNTFLNLLKLPTNIVDNTNINPVLTGIVVECKDKQLTIISSNNNLSLRSSCDDVEIIKTGKVLIRGKLLFSIINKLKQSKITFEVVDNSIVRISTNNFSSDINLLDDVSYPSINFNFES
jgi:DNA polymerase III sliding clamp (beta) subunit (PCNA family)